MQKRPSVLRVSGGATLTRRDLERYLQGWVMDGEIRGFTSRTLAARKFWIKQLLWFVENRSLEEFGPHEARQVLAYVTRGHEEPGGRWGNPKGTEPNKPRTCELFFDQLQAFCRWLIEEEALEASPLAKLRPPIVRQDEIVPFSADQIDAILAAAQRSPDRRRDEALITFLLDTGIRKEELCAIKVKDIDFQEWCVQVHGKGNKVRPVPFGMQTKRCLWKYLQEKQAPPEASFFRGHRGKNAGLGLGATGVYRIVTRACAAAGVQGARCSPHTFRHTFAIHFLRNGGGEFSLMKILGHTSLTMTLKYAAIAKADIQKQHRLYSPVDRRRRKD